MIDPRKAFVVEVNEVDGSWGPVEVSLDRKVADSHCRSWKRDAPHHKWRVRQYTPSSSEGVAKSD